MADHIYKKIELTGSSNEGVQQAIENAITRASQTIHNLRWFEVTDIRGNLENGKVDNWQVTVKIGFTLNEGDDATAETGDKVDISRAFGTKK